MASDEFREAPSQDELNAPPAASPRSLSRQMKAALRNTLATLLLPLAKLENLAGSFIAILSYRRVLPDFPAGSPRTGNVDPAGFAAQLEFLIRKGYDVLSLEGLAEALGGGAEAPRRAVVITFDDGYADHYLTAYKIGQEYEVPLNFFIPSGIIGMRHWPYTWDKRTPQEEWHMAHYPELWRPLTWEEVRQMKKGGAHFGCHGYLHRRLSQLSAAELAEEIGRGVATFEERLGRPPRFFSIPWGDTTAYTPQALELLQRHGVERAFTTHPRRIELPYRGFLIPRIPIGEGDGLGAFSRKIQGAHDMLAHLLRPLRRRRESE